METSLRFRPSACAVPAGVVREVPELPVLSAGSPLGACAGALRCLIEMLSLAEIVVREADERCGKCCPAP